VDPAIQRFLLLRIDVSLPDQAAESGLDMRTRAAEAVVKVEMPEGRIEVVAPEQANHAAAEPDAFRVAGRPAQGAGSLGDFVDLLLAFLRGIGLRGIGGRFLRLGWLAVPALRKGCRSEDSQSGRTAKHGKNLTQLERKQHCPRRMCFYLVLRRPSRPVCNRIGTLIRRCFL